jgi:tetratricopeptide (TPR) repeat protein
VAIVNIFLQALPDDFVRQFTTASAPEFHQLSWRRKSGQPAAVHLRTAQASRDTVPMHPRPSHPQVAAQLQEAARRLRSGQVAGTIGALRQLSQQYPDDAAVMRMLGIVLAQSGRLEEAEPLLARVTRLHPDSAMAASDHGNVLLGLNRFNQALTTLQAHEEECLNPRENPGAISGADPGESLEPADRAVFAFNLGRAYKQSGLAEQAVPPLLLTLQAQPQHYGALIVLGDVYKALGQAGAAADCYRRAISTNPADGTGWWSLSNLKAGVFTASETLQLRQEAAKASNPRQKMMFEFALAGACDQAGDFDQAFSHYAAGNRLAQQREPWDRHQFRAWLRKLQQEIAGVDLPPRPTDWSGQQPRPVFIISLPRSGSTLVEQVLAAHSQVTAASELPWIPQIIAAEASRQGTGLSHWMAGLAAPECQRLGEEYLQLCQHWTRHTPVFTDKLPGNLPYIGAILRMLPQALVVAVRRNAMDVCWSCYRQLLMGGSEFIYDFQSLADYWTDFEQHLDFWAQHAPGRVLSLQYEELVQDPETQTRRLLEFAGLEFEPGCLSPQQAIRAVNTASALQVREPIHSRGIGHWQRYAKHLGELQAALANQPRAPGNSPTA